MYYLKKNPVMLYTASLPMVEEVVKGTNQRLADASAGLTFDPEPHKYYLGGRELRSVSSIVEYFAPFDAMATAIRCSSNPRHKHFGKKPEEIVAIWSEEGRQAAEAGTKVHAFAEACCSYLSGREEEIESEFRDRVTSEGLAAVTPKEEAVAKWWADKDWSRYAVVAKETRVVNPTLQYAGTFDLLLYDLYNRNYRIDDYKTNKDLERWFGDYLLPPLAMIKSNDLGKYTLQQTSYTIVLRNIGLTVAANELIWATESGYRVYNLPMEYDRVIHYGISNYILNNPL
jgi:hypothetical protein